MNSVFNTESRLEVVPASRKVEIQANPGVWTAEWISESQGLAVTSEVLHPERFESLGLLHVWSLQTCQVLRSIEVPARLHVIVGGDNSPIVFVAGGPYGKYSGAPFVWRLNLRSGEVLYRMPVWPRDESHSGQGYYAFPSIQDGALIDNNRRLLLRFREGCASYNLSILEQTPTMLPPEAWSELVEPGFSSHKDQPNWMDKTGVTDGKLTMNQVSGDAGVWRNDTWEKVAKLNDHGGEVIQWKPSPDGSVVLGVRGDASATHLIWDLINLEIMDWFEPKLLYGFVPAFTDNGKVIRYIRLASDGRLECVSRAWREGKEEIDYITPLVETFDFRERYVHAEFSDDGCALAISNETTTTILHWDPFGDTKPSIMETNLCLDKLAGITCDAGIVYYRPCSNANEELRGTAWGWDVKSGKGLEIVRFAEAMHTPSLVFQSHPEIRGEILAYRVSGASMGPYIFGLQIRFGPTDCWHALPQEDLNMLAGASFVRPRNGGGIILVAWFDFALRTYDPETGKMLSEIQRNDLWPLRGLQQRVTAPLAGWVFLGLQHGGALVIEVQENGTLKEIAQLWSPAPDSWLAIIPDGRYTMSPSARSPVFFRRDGKLHPVEDFDVHLNQPAAVAQAFGAHQEVLEELNYCRQKRLRRLGLTAAPLQLGGGALLTLRTIIPTRHDAATLCIEGEVLALETRINQIHLYVNDVPVFGKTGIAFDGQVQVHSRFEMTVPLTIGSNKVQLTANDESGTVLDRVHFLVHRSRTSGSPARLVLAIGVSNYDDDNLNLEYASKDAKDIAVALTAVPGFFQESRILVLTDREARRVGILAASEFLKNSKPEDEVIVFVAGHGVIDGRGDYMFCPADFHLNDFRNGVSYAELEGLFEGIPALNRLLLVDSCHAGELDEEQTREIEARFAAAFDIRGVHVRKVHKCARPIYGLDAPRFRSRAVLESFLDLRRTTGATVLTASGGMEFAMEGGSLRNGVFSYSIMKTLQTAAAADDVLTASDLVRKVAVIVQQMTEGLQNPNARFTNLANDFNVVAIGADLPPGGPARVIRHFVEWSCGANGPMHPRLMSCFAPEVMYFGALKSLTDIEVIEREFIAEFRVRSCELKKLEVGGIDESGAVSVRCDYDFDHLTDMAVGDADRILEQIAAGVETRWRDASGWTSDPDGQVTARMMRHAGTVKLEALLRQMKHEWRIVCLRIRE